MRFLLTIISLCVASLLLAQQESGDVRRGNLQYNDSNYTEAEVNYRRGLEKNNQSFEAHFNLGDALFRQEKYPEALEQYAEAEKLLRDAKLLDEAGCFAIVLEKIPAALAEKVTQTVSCPTIGIGAGNVTDGQVLVLHDMLGLNQGFKPKFLRHFAQLGEAVKGAVGEYIDSVKQSTFPNENESY